ncbi:MAG: SRPBCC domain-containing protein [Alphaproteobacteria bacterium]|nr:SRPBCC domain-containing protein [Alphaproteobacteria bacterium]
MSAQPATTEKTRPSLTLRRRYVAPPEKVFQAFTDPLMLVGWLGGGDVTPELAETDPRPGGRYRIVMHGAAGERHEVGGVYREVLPGRRLVFTWAWISTPERQSLVSVDFMPDGTGTILTLTHEQFFDEAARDRHHVGWTSSLDKLQALVG